jgi:hypothetical protein
LDNAEVRVGNDGDAGGVWGGGAHERRGLGLAVLDSCTGRQQGKRGGSEADEEERMMRLENRPSHKICAKEDEKQANQEEHIVQGTHKGQRLSGLRAVKRQFGTLFPKMEGPEFAFIAI